MEVKVSLLAMMISKLWLIRYKMTRKILLKQPLLKVNLRLSLEKRMLIKMFLMLKLQPMKKGKKIINNKMVN
jgi:hypothetical protein